MLTDRQLLDLSVAKAFFLQRLEAGMTRQAEQEFATYLDKLLAGVTGRVGRVDFATLSRGELRQIMVAFRALEGKLRPEFEAKMGKLLGGYVGREYALQRALWAWVPRLRDRNVVQLPEDEQDAATRQLYGFVTGSGESVSDLVGQITAGVRVEVTRILLAGDARNMPTGEVVAALNALVSKKGLRSRVGAAVAAAVVAGAALAFEKYARSAATKYVWLSVIDDRTSTVCRGLNRRVFEIGKGPLPPAHRFCRSTTAPVRDKLPEFSLKTWLLNQLPALRVAMLAAAPLSYPKYQEKVTDYVQASFDED